MERIIELVEEQYGLTHIGIDENGVHLFKCNDCGEIHRIQIIAPIQRQLARQSVPDAFYKAFSNAFEI